MPTDDKTYPSFEAEVILLGSVLLDEEILDAVGDSIRPDDFRIWPHQVIYLAVSALHKAGYPIDLENVRTWLGERDLLGDAGGIEYLVQLVESTPTSINPVDYTRIIRENADQ